MRKIGSREFKNRMGKYLQAVRTGQTLIITDRGQAVAKVGPPDRKEHSEKSIEDRLRELEALGMIRLASRPVRGFKTVPARGKPASRILIEDRV